MLPISQKPPPPDDVVLLNKPKTPEEKPLINRKNSFNTCQLHLLLHHPRLWLLLSIALLQFLLLLSARSLSFSTTTLLSPTPSTITAATATTTLSATPPITINNSGDEKSTQCPFGKVYVYNLPSTFNTEIVENCDQLNPWTSGCDALSNDGFGREAHGVSSVVPENLTHAWFWTDQFALEIIHHNRMMNYECRTLEPELAAAYYIPFYAGLAVGKYLWSDKFTSKDRDRHCEVMLRWVRDQPYWNRSDGWDHFISMGRITWDFRRSNDEDWGSSCIYLSGMRNITRLLIERNPWDYFDVGVPYPTGFHPTSVADITQWQNFVRSRQRSRMYCFAGATRGFIKNDFRGLLLSQCYSDPHSCGVVDCAGSKCANGTSEILKTFLDSDFCLQPRGDSFTRRSIFDCMIAGSIPVFFWKRTAYFQYEWFLPTEPESYSVFIDRNGVKNGTILIKSVLQSISQEKIKSMREKVIESIPRLVYARPNQGLDGVKDAFDFAVEGVLKRIKEQESGYKW